MLNRISKLYVVVLLSSRTGISNYNFITPAQTREPHLNKPCRVSEDYFTYTFLYLTFILLHFIGSCWQIVRFNDWFCKICSELLGT